MIHFNLKMHFGFLMIIVCLLLTSCKNDFIDIDRKDAKINILLNNVISPFTAYTKSDMEMYKEDGYTSKVVVKAFVYDDSGYLIKSFTKELTDYKQSSVSFTTSLTGSNPKVVCVTYVTFTDPQGNKLNAYNVSGEEMLSTLKVEKYYADYVDNIPGAVLGGAIKSIGITSDITTIEVKPLGGLVYLDWRNIHAHDGESKAPQRYALMMKYNDIAMVKDDKFSFSSSLSSTYYFYTAIVPSNYPSYNGIYEIRFMLPCNVEYFGYGSYSPSNYKVDGDEEVLKKTNNKYIQVDAGRQYVFKLDCDKYVLEAKEGVLD